MSCSLPSFSQSLAGHAIDLRKARPRVLQLNTGYRCNLSCRHCHLRCGPGRVELMSPRVMRLACDFAARFSFAVLDVTGGAPELVPGITDLILELGRLPGRKIWRSNLLALAASPGLAGRLAEQGFEIVASLPSLSQSQTDAVRGQGVFAASLSALKELNSLGFGSGRHKLNLATNPAGAFAPQVQDAAQKQFQRELARGHGISFDALYVFANQPLGRFRDWLSASGNLDAYLQDLFTRFNPAAAAGLMCRETLSVDYKGDFFDCDFNQAAGLPSQSGLNLADLTLPEAGSEIALAEHCYACAAGSGFT